ncbi:TPA: AAA family ATPase [Burkholderia vietnamiensis]|nr:AAA family ATPase [Burkholderia vietnamiensis]
MAKTETFVFQVAEIKFAKEGFHIVRTTRGDSVKGKFAAREGYCYKAEGKWVTDPMWGPQYLLDSAVSVRMTTPEALGKFLVLQMKGKGLIGEAVIGSLVEACKADNLDLEELLDKAQRDVLVECVGSRNAKKIDALLDAWPKIKPAADLMSPLLGYGLSEAMAETAIALWGKNAVKFVEDHPYDLILKLEGVAFLTADKIAMRVGLIEKTDPVRLRAALAAGMRDATSNGDIGVRRKTLLDKTMPLVNEAIVENGRRKLAPGVVPVVSMELLTKTLNDMIAGAYKDDDGIECGFSSNLMEYPDEKGETVVWYRPLVEAEELIAKRLSRFNAAPRPDLVAKIDAVAASLGAKLAPEQRAGIEMALTHPVSIITGGPGCGKSFQLKVALQVLDAALQKGNLAAPTGKAAKRITESTGRPAATQHSLIGYQPGGRCAFDQSCPLPAHYLVIDEASMDDTELMAATLNAAANNCRIIIVGDVDQLASVGPGQVLRDLIRSGVVPVTRLTHGFRFGGAIKAAARAINAGTYPESAEDADSSFEVVDTETPTQDLLEAVKKLLRDGVNPDDIQILAPTHKGDAGCTALNKAMQALLNPEPKGGTTQRIKRDNGDIRVGDRVIQLKNDKDLGIVNGDVGWVTEITSDGTVTLLLPDREKPVKMNRTQAQNLSLAYAITVHKSQGAEAPYVLIALDRAASFMLRRNLVYTAVSRGSKLVKVFSSRATLAGAVHRGEPAEGSRRTSLVPKLRALMPVLSAAAPAKVATPLAEAMLLGSTPDVPF